MRGVFNVPICQRKSVGPSLSHNLSALRANQALRPDPISEGGRPRSGRQPSRRKPSTFIKLPPPPLPDEIQPIFLPAKWATFAPHADMREWTPMPLRFHLLEFWSVQTNSLRTPVSPICPQQTPQQIRWHLGGNLRRHTACPNSWRDRMPFAPRLTAQGSLKHRWLYRRDETRFVIELGGCLLHGHCQNGMDVGLGKLGRSVAARSQ